MNKIPGPALCGFADYFEDDHVVGAGKPHPTKPHKSTAHSTAPPAGSATVPKPYPKPKQSSTIANHAKVLKNARQILAKSHGQVKLAARRTLVKPVAPIAKPVLRTNAARALSRVAVHGDDYVILGAALPAAQQPKVKNAVAKLATARANVKKAAAVAATKTKAAHVTVTKLAAQVKNHENVARALSGKRGGARGGAIAAPGVHGYYIGDDAAGLWPGDAGYDPTTENGTNGPAGANPWDGGTGVPATVDPSTGLPATDPTTGIPVSAAALDVDTLVAAATAAPIPISTFIADTTGLPIIPYNGSKGAPDGYVLSYGLATRDTDVYAEPGAPGTIDGTAHFGYCWKTYPSRVGGIPWGEDMGKDGWNHLHGRHWESEGGWSTPCDAAEAFASNSKQVDIDAPGARLRGYISGVARNASYGPLIGNPKMADFVNLRVDAAGNMFWMANEAPDYITAPLKAAAALTAAAAAKAQKDADAAAAAAAAKQAADDAATLAAQNAQNALDEANAASQGRQATSQAQGQADLADAASAQSDAQYSAADASQAQADAQNAAAQYQQDLAERQWQFQQAQQQAQQQQQEYQQYLQQQQAYAQQNPSQPPQYQPPPQAVQVPQFQDQYQQQYVDDGSGTADGGDGGGDGGTADGGGGDTFSPEGSADDEAANIENDTEVLGQVLPPIVGDNDVVGGDGSVIGFDQFGNAQND